MPEQDDKISAPEDAVEDLELADADAGKVTGGYFLKLDGSQASVESMKL